MLFPADDGSLDACDADLAEAEPDGPAQEFAVAVDPGRRAGIARSVEHKFGDLRLI